MELSLQERLAWKPATCEFVEGLCVDLTRLRSERNELRDKLPKTADGVPVVPGMTVWTEAGLINGRLSGPRQHDGFVILSDGKLLGEVEEYLWTFYADECYSTRAAAEAAFVAREK